MNEICRHRMCAQLPASDADVAMEQIAGELETIVADGRELLRVGAPAVGEPPRALLLPPYDEYTVAYADRSAVGEMPAHVTSLPATSRLEVHLVLDGQVIGSWARRVEGGAVTIVLVPFWRLAAEDRALLVEEARRYARFRGARARGRSGLPSGLGCSRGGGVSAQVRTHRVSTS